MTKYKFLIILIFSYCLGHCRHFTNNNYAPFSKDSIAESKLTLTNDNGSIKIIIEYKANASGTKDAKKDSSQKKSSVFEQFFGSATIDKIKVLTEEGIKNELLKIISSNQDIDIEAQYPDYILETFTLIRGQKKKNKAKELYIRNNPDKMVSSNRQGNYVLENGNYTNRITLSYTCVVRPKKTTKIIIPEFLFEHDNKTYRTKTLIIDL